jgi:pectinesterase
VEVGKSKKNLMFIGDGIGKTVIKASRNVVDGSTTFRSATVAVVGNNFLARDLTIENSAGPSKHQAVALRVGADLSAFYRCSFVGYQDTLYVHSLRQFFRECDIYGTIDFIFGNSAVVFQSCNLYARRPLPNQSNVYTAQGREDPNQNTGISIQKCKVAAASDLLAVQSSFKTYLGRPWKQYSRTVFMQSELDSVVNPAGWLEWSGNFALDTLYYGEYQNTGPGASTSNRVKWKGYRVITSASEASTFTVGNFIDGDVWLAGTSVPFTVGL